MRLGNGELKLLKKGRDTVAGRDAFSDESNFTPDTSHCGP